MSKQDELDKLKKLQSHNEKSREGMADSYRKRTFEIIALEAEIAEEAKPKLRHGDYGISKNGMKFIILSGMMHTTEDTGFTKVTGCEWDVLSYILGNIFDDLTAMQEDVTEFEMDDIMVSADSEPSDGVLIRQDSDNVRVMLENMPGLIRGLRQMQATLNRKKGSE